MAKVEVGIYDFFAYTSMNEIQIWRRILRILFDSRKHKPPGAVERSELANSLGISVESVRFYTDYLIEQELIRVLASPRGQSNFQFVQITSEGINLVVDQSEFNTQFPPQTVVQNIFGDRLDITIGDYASNVAVGKDIRQVQVGADTQSLDEVCSWFIEDTTTTLHFRSKDKEKIQEKINSLLKALSESEPDLGEIQRIKQFLAEQEGQPAIRTAVLFSHSAVARPIRQTVERLIGYPEGSELDA